MTAIELIAELEAAGIRITLSDSGDKIRVRAPSWVLSARQIRRLRECKAEAIALLKKHVREEIICNARRSLKTPQVEPLDVLNDFEGVLAWTKAQSATISHRQEISPFSAGRKECA